MRRFADESNTQRAEAERALAETARVNEARAQLIRGITHDVKNPLGAARGYAELLAAGIKGPVHADQLPLLQGIARSVNWRPRRRRRLYRRRPRAAGARQSAIECDQVHAPARPGCRVRQYPRGRIARLPGGGVTLGGAGGGALFTLTLPVERRAERADRRR